MVWVAVSVSVSVYVCVRARVGDRRGGRERFNIFPVTYESMGELLVARLGPCVYQCGCIFLVCPTCECHGVCGSGCEL